MVNNTEQTLASVEYVTVGKLRTRKNGKMLKEMAGGEWRLLAGEGLSELPMV